MATYISDVQIAHLQTNPSALEYVTLTGDASRSGNTVTLSNLNVSVRVTYVYSVYGETQTYYIADSSSSTTQLSTTGSFGFDFNDGPNHTQNLSMSNMSFSVSTSQTSKTLYLRAVGNEDAQIPFTVTFPAGTSAPEGLAISNVVPGTNSVTATWSVDVWNGTPGTFECDLGNSTTTTSGLRVPRYYTEVETSSLTTTQTLSASSSHTGGTFTISPNTQYFLFGYATNSNGDVAEYTDYYPFVTLAEAPTVSVSSVDSTSVTVAYTTASGGGYYAQNIQYSLDGGTTWVTADTVASGTTAATSGTYTITGLTPGTTYSIQTRVSTTAGTTTGSTLTAITTSAEVLLYEAVEQELSFEVAQSSGFGTIQIDQTALYNAIESYLTGSKKPDYLYITSDSSHNIILSIYYADGTSEEIGTLSGAAALRNTYGITVEKTYTSSSTATISITMPSFVSEKIEEFYGPVNGKSKKIYKFYGGVKQDESATIDGITITDEETFFALLKSVVPEENLENLTTLTLQYDVE